jgi:hypothetical protein
VTPPQPEPDRQPSLPDDAAALLGAAGRYVAARYPAALHQVGEVVSAAVSAVRATLDAVTEPTGEDAPAAPPAAPPTTTSGRVQRIVIEGAGEEAE